MYIPIPPIIPFEIEYIKGRSKIVTKAGTPSLISFHSISLITFIIIAPTITKDGPMAHGGTLLNSGMKNIDKKK